MSESFTHWKPFCVSEKPFEVISRGEFGVIVNSARSVWSITSNYTSGANLDPKEVIAFTANKNAKRRAASVNSTVNKTSAGAVEHMKIARVNNITDTISKLKDKGIWICGTAIDAEKYYYDQDLKGPLAIVIGNEGKGWTKEIRTKSRKRKTISSRKKLNSKRG